MEASSLLSILDVIFQILMAFGTLLLSYVIWRGSNKIAKTEYTRSIQDSWITANVAVLESEELCKIAYELTNTKSYPQSLDENSFYRRRYLKFLYLNIIEAVIIGKSNGMIDDDYSSEISKDLLEILLRDPETIDQIDKGGFSSLFVKYCNKLLPKKIS